MSQAVTGPFEVDSPRESAERSAPPTGGVNVNRLLLNVEGSLSAVDPGAGTTIYRGALTEEPCFELVFRPWLIPPGVQIATGLFVIGGGICRWLRFNYIKPGGLWDYGFDIPGHCQYADDYDRFQI
jgi:hypothetical protein